MSGLAFKALLSVLLLAVVMGLIIFTTAGHWTIGDYWQAWVYLIVFTVISLFTTIYLIRNDPELLKRRMRGGPTAEKRASQRVIMFFTSLAFISLLVVPALDHRLGWSTVPFYVVIAGDTLVAIGFYFIFLVYRENTYTSATIEVAANQKVIESGPYSLVRHPMYASATGFAIRWTAMQPFQGCVFHKRTSCPRVAKAQPWAEIGERFQR
ncbi:MAG TPA: isoprenylcysteine carboxylmethyltransferase family protein [Pyrinomonadaceae bacterium]|nr:isoprenylcysteine carboxylmethyltransferase family protein [Pyrinomonadaceae bacterium]